MATLIGKGYIFGLGTCALTFTYSGFSSRTDPNYQGGTLTHNAEEDRIKDLDGDIVGVTYHGDYIEWETTAILEGSTIAAAKTSGYLPKAGAYVTSSGLPVIAFGGFTDVLNVATVNDYPWIYPGGGRVTMANAEKWQINFTLRRFPSIQSGTPIT